MKQTRKLYALTEPSALTVMSGLVATVAISGTLPSFSAPLMAMAAAEALGPRMAQTLSLAMSRFTALTDSLASPLVSYFTSSS